MSSQAGLNRLSRVQLGRMAESLAASYLVDSGYILLQRNYRCQEGEIDLIAWDGDILCFVEVRARSGVDTGLPLESIGVQKIQRITKAARHFIAHCLEGGFPVMRFDAVGVVFEENDAPSVVLVKDAFETLG